MSFFWGHWYPCFWISGDVSSGFQSLLAAGMQPVTSPHACAEVGLGSDSNVQLLGQKTNALPLCQRPGTEKLLCKPITYI